MRLVRIMRILRIMRLMRLSLLLMSLMMSTMIMLLMMLRLRRFAPDVVDAGVVAGVSDAFEDMSDYEDASECLYYYAMCASIVFMCIAVSMRLLVNMLLQLC